MKYIKVILLTLAVGLAPGCTDWFGVKPKSQIRAEELFKTRDGFWQALTGVYINMGHENAYGKNLTWGGIEFMAWNHRNFSGASGSYYDLQTNNYTSTKAETFINNTWARMYNIIAEANYILFALDEYGGHLSSADYDNIKGQAIAIRAYCHFDLMRLFAQGNLANDPDKSATLEKPCIPYVKEYSKVITDQLTYGETLDLLMDDIFDAIELLGQSNITQYKSNVSIYAALLLAARVHMWYGSEPEVVLPFVEPIVETVELGDNALVWNANSTTNKDDLSPTFSSELIFCLTPFNMFSLTENMWNIEESDRLVSLGPKSVHDGLYVIQDDNRGIVEVPNISSIDSDMRLMSWYASDTADPSITDDDERLRSSIKIKTKANGTANTLAMMRISEAYLINAECLIEGNPERAIELINILREKRNIDEGHYVQPDATAEQLREVIKYEMVRESVQEGQAFFFYKRTGALRMINQPGSNIMLPGDYMLPYPQNEQEIGHTNKENDDENLEG